MKTPGEKFAFFELALLAPGNIQSVFQLTQLAQDAVVLLYTYPYETPVSKDLHQQMALYRDKVLPGALLLGCSGDSLQSKKMLGTVDFLAAGQFLASDPFGGLIDQAGLRHMYTGYALYALLQIKNNCLVEIRATIDDTEEAWRCLLPEHTM